MPHNSDPSSHPEFALQEGSLLAVHGRDAFAFLHAQTMNDVAALADGQWQWNGWLTPQGRVVALFALLRRNAQTAWLFLPDFNAHTLAEQWRRYVFRAKLTLEPRTDLHLSGRFAVRGFANPSIALLGEESASFDFSTAGTPRTLQVGTQPAAADPESASRWRETDLAAGLPRLDAGSDPAWTPQQLALGRLNAYSVKKGCYPGQEIVARTHFLGQAKRQLMLVHAQAPLAVGLGLSDGERELGRVIASERRLAQAVLPLGASPTHAGQTAVRLHAFEDGLAR